MTDLSLGPVERLILIGGGRTLTALAAWAKKAGTRVQVVTAARHAAESIGPGAASLASMLKEIGVETTVVNEDRFPAMKLQLGDMSHAFVLSLGAAWMFDADTLTRTFGNRLLNSHGTRLPQNRGGGGFSWQILTGNRFGYNALHLVAPSADTGDLLALDEFIYPASCRIPADYMSFYEDRNFKFLTGIISTVLGEQRSFRLMPQPEYLSSYWPRLHTETHSWINWDWNASDIERFVCAFDDPYGGAQTTYRGKTIRLKKCFASYQDQAFHPFQAGLVYRNNGRWICVAARNGSVVFESVEGDEGLRLSEVRVGERLITPVTQIEAAMCRVSYSASGLQMGSARLPDRKPAK